MRQTDSKKCIPTLTPDSHAYTQAVNLICSARLIHYMNATVKRRNSS